MLLSKMMSGSVLSGSYSTLPSTSWMPCSFAGRQFAHIYSTQLKTLAKQRSIESSSRCYCTSESIKTAQEEASTRLPRFYVEKSLISLQDSHVRLSHAEAKHAVKVLRMKDMESIELCDGQGYVTTAQLQIGPKTSSAMAHIQDEPKMVPWLGPRLELVVACASLKGGRADWMVEKCTELGAWALQPLLTRRSHAIGRRDLAASLPRDSAEEDEDASGREGRWARVALAAAKQCLRAHFLDIRPAVSLTQLLPQLGSADPAPVLLVAAAGGRPLLQVLKARFDGVDVVHDSQRVLMFVGPEGDFTPEELQSIISAGALPVGLGDNRLRVETAAVSLLAGLGLYFDQSEK